jgi:membrane-bound lytic murein transglycosylase MltF
MQVKPSTAAGDPINIRDVRKLENNIHAGAKYDRHLIDHYFTDATMDSLNKQLFALAAYNAGPSRISHLRQVAKSRKLNPDVWFNQVEMVVAHEVGRETVQYVSNIYKYYISLSALRAYERSTGKAVWSAPANP